MSILCLIGIHRWNEQFVGHSWNPYLHITCCSRCGIEKGH